MLNSGMTLQNRYWIIRHIGIGGMSSVYLANDLQLNIQVVVKENHGGDPQQFLTEAQILATLRHPNLPRVSAYWIELRTSMEYLAMDYIEGQTLQKIMENSGPLAEQDALDSILQVLDAVRYLHTKHIIHRDIKPANIIIQPDSKVMLVDFGIAKVLQQRQGTPSGARGAGTVGYAPPEQYPGGGGTDERSDIYALGATLYALLVGNDPPESTTIASGTAILTPPSKLNPNVSKKVEQAILLAMQIDPNARFRTVADMKQVLFGMPPPPPLPLPPKNRGSKNGIIAGILAIVLVFCFWWVRENLIVTPSMPTSPALSLATSTATRVLPSVVPVTTATAHVLPIATIAIPTATPRPGEERMIGGAPMVFVPAGDFLMGSNDTSDNEKPQHTVYLDAFWIDKYEVSNGQYRKCVSARICPPPELFRSSTREFYYYGSQFDNYPVIYIWWDAANTFCNWAGKRLPTEAEWEKAARGTDGRKYPWGNTFDKFLLNSWNSGAQDTVTISSYPGGSSPYGAMNMSGNVWEWVADGYDEGYYAKSPRNNPKGPLDAMLHVIWGGGWRSEMPYVGVTYRKAPTFEEHRNPQYPRMDDFGFRCSK